MANDTGEKVLVAGVICTAVYLAVVRPIMNAFDLSPEQQAAVNKYKTLPAYDNPFSVAYQPFIDYYGDQWASIGIKKYFENLKDEYGPTWYGSKQGRFQLVDDAETIKDFSSIWQLNPDINGVVAVFRNLTAKTDVSFIAAYLFYNYNIDLWSYLQRGEPILPFLGDGMTGQQFADIIEYIDTLPDSSDDLNYTPYG